MDIVLGAAGKCKGVRTPKIPSWKGILYWAGKAHCWNMQDIQIQRLTSITKLSLFEWTDPLHFFLSENKIN